MRQPAHCSAFLLGGDRKVLGMGSRAYSNDVGYLANNFLQDLERTCKDHIIFDYRKVKTRAYDATLMPQAGALIE